MTCGNININEKLQRNSESGGDYRQFIRFRCLTFRFYYYYAKIKNRSETFYTIIFYTEANFSRAVKENRDSGTYGKSLVLKRWTIK